VGKEPSRRFDLPQQVSLNFIVHFTLRLLPALAMAGCASTTTIAVNPAPQAPVCDAFSTGVVFWRTQWRVDQKDALEREAAAAQGIGQFFEVSPCFKSVSVQRLRQLTEEQAKYTAELAAVNQSGKVVLVSVRELGPTVKVGSSIALVEGGTEAVLDVSEFISGRATSRTFSVRWNSKSPGVLKGVASLPQDMQAALSAALQPGVR
jgi:hypothetical protein